MILRLLLLLILPLGLMGFTKHANTSVNAFVSADPVFKISDAEFPANELLVRQYKSDAILTRDAAGYSSEKFRNILFVVIETGLSSRCPIVVQAQSREDNRFYYFFLRAPLSGNKCRHMIGAHAYLVGERLDKSISGSSAKTRSAAVRLGDNWDAASINFYWLLRSGVLQTNKQSRVIFTKGTESCWRDTIWIYNNRGAKASAQYREDRKREASSEKFCLKKLNATTAQQKQDRKFGLVGDYVQAHYNKQLQLLCEAGKVLVSGGPRYKFIDGRCKFGLADGLRSFVETWVSVVVRSCEGNVCTVTVADECFAVPAYRKACASADRAPIRTVEVAADLRNGRYRPTGKITDR